jgi:hypothetical protein
MNARDVGSSRHFSRRKPRTMIRMMQDGIREMPKQQASAGPAATLRLTRPMLYSFTAGFMTLVGTVFWTAGYAAGLRTASLLVTLFVMGASTGLLVLVLWFLAQVRPAEAGNAAGPLGEHR